MHWYEWVFSGIGVLILSYLIQRWVRSGQANNAMLTAQDAKVTNSPVASGSGIIQIVNSPTTVHLNADQAAQAALPKLNVEIREVCFGDVLDSLTEDFADFTVERYIFVYVWVVNTENVATAVKEWKLTYSKGETTLAASDVRDFSKWHQNVKWEERSSGFVTHVIKEAHNSLTPFPSDRLQQGIPSQGWVCFKATGVTGKGSADGSVELCLADSFGQEYRVESPAPLSCKGRMVNPEISF